MTFSDEIRRWVLRTEAMSNAVFVGTVATAFESITVGSPITGAPGQPVDEGQLRVSWQQRFDSATKASITTNSPYARANEDGVTDDGRPYIQRSPVGGRRSVALTIAGMDRIVAHETAKARGRAP